MTEIYMVEIPASGKTRFAQGEISEGRPIARV
jgi:hypothetical protein